MKSKMKFKHLDRQYEEIKDQIHQAITDVLESGQYIQGENVKKLEKNWQIILDQNFASPVQMGLML